MVSIDDYIEQLTAGQESDDLEFKTAKGGFPGSFWETYSAFANTNGGTIILGVVENASGLILQGIDDSMVEKYKKEFWSTVNNRNKISVNILTNNDVQETEYDGHKFLVFFIPRAKREQRPVFCGTNPEHGTYKRNNEGDYITQMLKKLCRNGLLIASGLGRGTHYSTPKDDKVATLNGKVATFDMRKETNNQMELFDDKGNAVAPNVSIKVATSDEKVATSDEKALSERKRLKKEILQKEIILFCSTWKSLSEIASYVGKNYNYLRNKVIPEMVKDGYLIPHYPDKKNHPDQKYRINK